MAFLFSPREGVEERLAERRRLRIAAGEKVKGNGTGRTRAPGRTPGEFYTPKTYHHAVRYGCKRADVPAWHPHQLRHNAATWLRERVFPLSRTERGPTTEAREADTQVHLSPLGNYWLQGRPARGASVRWHKVYLL